jgi:hypothetical protein
VEAAITLSYEDIKSAVMEKLRQRTQERVEQFLNKNRPIAEDKSRFNAVLEEAMRFVGMRSSFGL